jgi:hypothetical protein
MKLFAVLALAAAPMDPVDFLTDWPSLLGQSVTLENMEVFAFSERSANGKVGGQYVTLHAPWAEREDLRFLFAHCATFRTGKKCVLTVTGTVSKDIGGDVQLSDVDFVIPR